MTKKKIEPRVIDKVKAASKIYVPYNVWTMFGEEAKTILIGDDSISLGCDYKSVKETREGIEWYVTQMGGKVTWEK